MRFWFWRGSLLHAGNVPLPGVKALSSLNAVRGQLAYLDSFGGEMWETSEWIEEVGRGREALCGGILEDGLSGL